MESGQERSEDIAKAYVEGARLNVPPGLAKRMAAVMVEVPKIAHNLFNAHAGYNYASVDAIYAAVRPIMAKHGVSMFMTEVGYLSIPVKTRNGEREFMGVDFDFIFVCEDGVSSPMRVRGMAERSMGSQAFGAAQAYAQKMALRRALLLETGERDADDHEQPKDPSPAKSADTVKKPRKLAEDPVMTLKQEVVSMMKALGLTKENMKALTLALAGESAWAKVGKEGAMRMAKCLSEATKTGNLEQVSAIIAEQKGEQ